MTKDNDDAGGRFHILSRKRVKIYQRTTGNEGPSPLMKQYLKMRKKGQSTRPVEGGPGKTP